MASNSMETFIGTWDHIRTENLEDFLKELGAPMPMRMMAKRMNPRVVISQNNGVWTIQTETAFRTQALNFTPGVEFEDSAPNGEKLKTVVTFEDGKWVQNNVSLKDGKKSSVLRYIDADGSLKMDMSIGNVKATRWFKRA